MIRTQIQLTEAQVRTLKRIATSQSISMAEVIRRAIDLSMASDHGLGRDELRRRAAAAAGRFRDEGLDVATEHDALAAQAFEGKP